MLNQNSGEIENWGAEANVGYQFNPVERDGKLQLASHGKSGIGFSGA